MNFRKSNEYEKDLQIALNQVKGMETLKNKSVCISGASGLIGSFIVDMLIKYNETANADIKIYAMGRSKERLSKRFGDEKQNLIFLQHDVNYPLEGDTKFNYIIHAASNAFPKVITRDPVGTITSNIIGTMQLIEYGMQHNMNKFLYVSSGEVYGEIEGEYNAYKENFNGYIDILSTRSCYPLSKRTAENLCISYVKQYKTNILIVRPSHVYGPNTVPDDNRANVQFVNNIMNDEDIVLKSSGSQVRSYTYVADCAAAILYVLLNGSTGEAYNISNSNSVVSIADFARTLAKQKNKKVVFKEESDTEEKSPFSKQVLDSNKLEELGWKANFDIDRGIQRTISILEEIKGMEDII